MRLTLLLVLLAMPFFFAVPTLADTSSDNWKIGVLASNSETRVVSGSEYCLMPASMPIRPGNHVLLRNAENDTLVTAIFYDSVEENPDPERYEPDEECRLVAIFPPVTPRDGFQIVIKPYPPPVERSPSLRVTIGVSVSFPQPFDWWHDDSGYKRCRSLEEFRFGHGSPVATTPDSRLLIEGYPSEPRFVSNVTRSELRGEDVCHILTSLEFPIADEYVIEFGGEMPDGE